VKIRVEWQFLRYADPDENSNKFWEYHVISVDDGRGFMRTGGTVYRWGRTGAVGQTKHEWAAPYARADQKRRKGYTTVYSETFEYNSLDEFMASGHMVEKVKGTWIAAFGLPDTPSEVPGESLAKEAFALTQ
jgi:predicted DNA-binding WGR domain protein